MTKTVRAIFWSAMPSNANFLRSHDKNLRFATLGKTFGRSVLELGSPPPVPTLSIHAKPALISGMGFHQKWTKTKVSRDQIQIQIHKYKYQYTNTNTNSLIQIQIQIQEGLRSQILTFFQKIKVSTKMAISLEPLDLHRFNTPQIEALCLPDEKNTSGGL